MSFLRVGVTLPAVSVVGWGQELIWTDTHAWSDGADLVEDSSPGGT